MKVLKDWEFKLASETFHGGKTPDAADFKCYSALQMHQHMPSYQTLMKGFDQTSKF